MSCCDDPRPRIGEATGRIFCSSCHTYLDSRGPESTPSAPEPRSDENPDDVANDTSTQEGDSQ